MGLLQGLLKGLFEGMLEVSYRCCYKKCERNGMEVLVGWGRMGCQRVCYQVAMKRTLVM